MTVKILGTEYTITVKKYDEDEAFERLSIDGYCDGQIKSIVICDMSTYKGWEHEPKETIEISQKQTLRHEIVHAFLMRAALLPVHLVLTDRGPKTKKWWTGSPCRGRRFTRLGRKLVLSDGHLHTGRQSVQS